jgi:hypothetical protein
MSEAVFCSLCRGSIPTSDFRGVRSLVCPTCADNPPRHKPENGDHGNIVGLVWVVTACLVAFVWVATSGPDGSVKTEPPSVGSGAISKAEQDRIDRQQERYNADIMRRSSDRDPAFKPIFDTTARGARNTADWLSLSPGEKQRAMQALTSTPEGRAALIRELIDEGMSRAEAERLVNQ